MKVSSGGAVLARRSVTVRVQAHWATSSRRRLWPRSPIYLCAGSGPAAGWWLPEQRDKVYLQGIAQQVNYTPGRRLTIAGGASLLAVKVDPQGSVTATQRVTTTGPMELTVDSRAVVNGNDRVQVSDGDLAGYWIQLRAGVRLF